MKLSLTFLTAAVCVAVPAVQAVKSDCLDSKRYNLESVCRTECEKVDAVAFSVSYDETNDNCRCYQNIDGLGSGDRESHMTCYSMAPGAKTRVLDYGDCIVDSSNSDGYATKIQMKECDDENQVDCLDEMQYNKESLCRIECSSHTSVAFAVSYADDDNTCRCYSDKGIYTGTGDYGSPLTCYSMDDTKTKLLGYGDCIVDKLDGSFVTEHDMKRCQDQPQVETLLRGNVPVQKEPPTPTFE